MTKYVLQRNLHTGSHMLLVNGTWGSPTRLRDVLPMDLTEVAMKIEVLVRQGPATCRVIAGRRFLRTIREAVEDSREKLIQDWLDYVPWTTRMYKVIPEGEYYVKQVMSA